AYLLRNEGGNARHWIEIKTIGRESNRDGIGARVEVRTGAERQIDEVRSGGSYLSQNDLRLHFGLGSHVMVDEVTLRWPSGRVDRLRKVPANRLIIVEEGKGLVRAQP
ncbi:MAG: RNA-binding protein, partial [Acidobacteria bacterium]